MSCTVAELVEQDYVVVLELLNFWSKVMLFYPAFRGSTSEALAVPSLSFICQGNTLMGSDEFLHLFVASSR